MFLEVENKQGIRYRVREGWHQPPLLPQAFAESNVDLELLFSFDQAVVEQIYDQLLRFEQQLPDPSNPRGRNPHASRYPIDLHVGTPPNLTDQQKHIYFSLAEQRLIIEENPLDEGQLAEGQSALANQIRRGLQQIIAEERAETARIQSEHEQRSYLGKKFAYIKRGAEGFGNAAWGLAIWAKDAVEVAAAVSPTRQAFAAANAAADYIYHDKPLQQSGREYLADVKGEVVDVLGFDPTSITAEQLRLAFEVAELIYADPALHNAIAQFAKDYVSAQHSLEVTEFAGGGVFEIVLTIVVAAVTGGVGAVAALAKNARLLTRFERIGELMMRFAKLRKQRLRLAKTRGAQRRSAEFSDLEAIEVPTSQAAPTLPEPRRGGAAERTTSTPNKAAVSPSQVDWSASRALGLEVRDPRDYEVGQKIFESLQQSGISQDRALRMSREMLESGVELPQVIRLKDGDELFKLVPTGSLPSNSTPYFLTGDTLEHLPKNTNAIGDKLGLPQIPDSFEMYSIKAKGDVDVFQSQIAQFSVNNGVHIRNGGEIQTLVTRRDLFSEATPLNQYITGE